MVTAVKAEKIACDQIAPNKQHQFPRIVGKGLTKDEAETDLNDKILEAVIDQRKTANVDCDDGKCDGGSCYTIIEIQNPLTFRRVRRKQFKYWLCIYSGNVRSSCVCVI